MSRLLAPLFFLLAIGASGCGVLLGNVKPVDEKADTYRILDLSRENPDWEKLENPKPTDDTESTEMTDVAYQSKRTASIISLNTACRERVKNPTSTLRQFTQELLLGFADVSEKKERELTHRDVPALETTITGKLRGQPMSLRAVVIRKDECLYDLMYVARPAHFSEQESDFSRFVESLRLR